MLSQRLLRAPLQLSAQRTTPLAFRAAAIAPFSTKPTTSPTPRQATPSAPKQAVPIRQWLAAPPAPGKNMVCHHCDSLNHAIARANSTTTDPNQSRHAPAHPLLFRQRSHLRLHHHPDTHLRLLEIHPAEQVEALRREDVY